jgi:hypothetical protein
LTTSVPGEVSDDGPAGTSFGGALTVTVEFDPWNPEQLPEPPLSERVVVPAVSMPAKYVLEPTAKQVVAPPPIG